MRSRATGTRASGGRNRSVISVSKFPIRKLPMEQNRMYEEVIHTFAYIQYAVNTYMYLSYLCKLMQKYFVASIINAIYPDISKPM